MNISGKKVLLRAIELDDAYLLHKWANDPNLWDLLGGWHFPNSLNSTRAWIEGLQKDPLNQRFAIESENLGLIGTANLIDIDWKNRNAFHGMMLGDKDIRGKGLGKDTIMAIMRYAFEELNLERLDGSIIEYNTASFQAYTKCGWKQEGVLRNWYFRKNRYWNKILVGITKSDYFDLIKQNNYWVLDDSK
jgi:RimJ/RimL family protein N-acetyltransferase